MARLSLRVLLFLSALAATPATALTITLTQAQLLAAEEVTTQFGGNGHVVSRAADGDGVLFTIQGGTTDFGKVALRFRLAGSARDLTAYDQFGLRIEIVSAPNPVEINPFVLTGNGGTQFYQDVPGVKVQGDGFTSFVPLAGILQKNNADSLGFQYFTAGNIVNPAAQLVQIRVSPLPEPPPWALALFAAPLLVRRGAARYNLRSPRRTGGAPWPSRSSGTARPSR